MSVYFYFIFSHSNLFLVQFRYVAKLFYLKIGKSSNSPQLVVQMLFWNRWNPESAGRVYFNISWEKPANTPDTPHVQPRSCKFKWTNQKHFYCFCWNQSETILLQGSPELLIFLLYMLRRALGRDWLRLLLIVRAVLVHIREREPGHSRPQRYTASFLS